MTNGLNVSKYDLLVEENYGKIYTIRYSRSLYMHGNMIIFNNNKLSTRFKHLSQYLT